MFVVAKYRVLPFSVALLEQKYKPHSIAASTCCSEQFQRPFLEKVTSNQKTKVYVPKMAHFSRKSPKKYKIPELISQEMSIFFETVLKRPKIRSYSKGHFSRQYQKGQIGKPTKAYFSRQSQKSSKYKSRQDMSIFHESPKKKTQRFRAISKSYLETFLKTNTKPCRVSWNLCYIFWDCFEEHSIVLVYGFGIFLGTVSRNMPVSDFSVRLLLFLLFFWIVPRNIVMSDIVERSREICLCQISEKRRNLCLLFFWGLFRRICSYFGL